MIFYPSARASIRMNFVEDPDTYYLLEVLPKFAKVELNSYQQADEFEVRMDYNVFPVDPRTIKSCGIGIWIGTTEKFGQLADNDPDKCLITGFVDEYDIRMDADDQTMTIKGRDFTGVLLDNKWFHGNVPLDMALDTTVAWILAHDPAFVNIKVVNKSKKEMPVLANIKLRNYEEHTPSKEDSYWDVIYDICLQAGFICYMRLDQLIIDDPKNLQDSSKITNFVYGINLMDLRFRKKFGRNQGLNIEVRSYDTTSKSTLVARYPDPPIDKKQMVIPSITRKLNNEVIHDKPPKKPTSQNTKKVQTGPAQHYEITTFIVSNVRDIEQLKKIAQSIWNQLYIREIDGELTTYDIQEFDNKGLLTDLRNGDAIAVTIGDRFKEIINSMPYEQKLDFLVNKGFNPTVAKEIANSTGNLDKVYYVQKARHEWDNKEGYSLSMDFVNFINMPKEVQQSGS